MWVFLQAGELKREIMAKAVREWIFSDVRVRQKKLPHGFTRRKSFSVIITAIL